MQKNNQITDQKQVMDARTVQSMLMKTRIPQKRTNKQRNRSEDNDDESDGDGQGRETQIITGDGNLSDGSDAKAPPNKRQKTTGMELEYDSPPEDAPMNHIVSQEQHTTLFQSIAASIESAKSLPISKHKQQIIHKLDRNRVLIISGDTGCGKTTQVPKYILECGMHRKQDVKIICTQPRRLAAVNIAKRVAQELGERVGETIGYQVGMQRKKTPGVTKIVFMTTGIFLMRLVNNPDSLKSYTHLIMDEVHERDLDIDFSLVVVKHLLSRSEADGLKFKLILMSATFNTALFANYFSKNSVAGVETINAYAGTEEAYKEAERIRLLKENQDWGPCRSGEWDAVARRQAEINLKKANEQDDEWIENKPQSIMGMPVKKTQDPAEIIEINAKIYEIKEFYLDKMIENLKKQKDIELSSQDKELLHEAMELSGSQKPMIKEGAMRAASLIICEIIEKLNIFGDDPLEKKSVLVFLPGLAEIFQFIDYLYEFYDHVWLNTNFDLIPLHSSLNEEEQDRAFKHVSKMEGKRKIIVATNIAESSITIPDIKYVIDFMLTKELHYDPVSKSESLQLQWCSKANAIQRAGRAGRCAEGLVFRLASERFYKNFMPEFPKPEMQRCPLEKLILQIKLWNRYEPDEILGRAIQPPELRDIFNAIKNLQQTGALTIPPPIMTENGKGPMSNQKEYKPKITALGKIFVNLPVDLKITRIFLFGMALKCMQQAINIGAIHAQTRSIFRAFRSADPVNTCKLQCMYDERRDSDSLMLLKVYQEWIHKFHPYLKHKKEDEELQREQQREQFQRNKGDGRRVFIKRPMASERKWCHDRALDINILREVATLAEEIRQRFMRMNISMTCLNSRVRMRDDNPDAELILKICIGGAFYNKYIKAAYKNEDILSRMRNHKFFNEEEAKNSIILNKVSEHITENHLRQYFEGKFKVPVTSIAITQDKPTIVFGPQLLERGFLKACFKLGMRNRISRYKKLQEAEYEQSQQFRSSIMSDKRAKTKDVAISYDEAREMLENEELRRPNYLYELRFETINKESFVDFDTDSINNFTYETDPNKLPHITYACQEYYDKGGRFLCRNGTKLPDVPMVDALYCLIFAPIVQVMADEDKTYFNKIICDNGENIIPLTHVLTHLDLELAQKVRNMLNESLCDEDKQKLAHLCQVDFYLKKLMGFNRLSVDIFVKLEALRNEDDTQDRSKILQTLNKQANDEDNFFLNEDEKNLLADGQSFEDVNMNEDGEILENRQLRYEQDCEKGYFLQPIYVQKISKKIYFYDELVQNMLKEFRERITKKREMIEENKIRCKEFALRDTMIICERCKQDLAPLKTFTFEREDLHYARCVFGAFRKISAQEALENQEYEEDRDFVELNKELYQEEMSHIPADEREELSFCECRKKHIVGIVKGQKYYLTDISQVMLMFPSGVYENWDARFWQKNYVTAFQFQDKLNYQRAAVNPQSMVMRGGKNGRGGRGGNSGRRSPQYYTPSVNSNGPIVTCDLCQVKCGDPEEFIFHCRKDELHMKLQEKFTDETYDFLFQEDIFGKPEQTEVKLMQNTFVQGHHQQSNQGYNQRRY